MLASVRACVWWSSCAANSVLLPFFAYRIIALRTANCCSHGTLVEQHPSPAFRATTLSWTLFLDELLHSTRQVCRQSAFSTSCDDRGLPLCTSGTINRGASGRLQETVYVEDCGSFSLHSSRTVHTYERIPRFDRSTAVSLDQPAI